MSSHDDSVNRRDFIRAATGVTAAIGAAGSAFARPAAKMNAARVIGANDRINVGVIGTGGRGSYVAGEFAKAGQGDSNAQVLAVCDVYQKRLTKNKERYKCDGYLDYRELLARGDIDAVVVATPDHWHAKIALEAMDGGKDVYLEKPMCHTIDEARQLVDTVKETKRVAAGRLADHLRRSVAEGQEGDRRRHDRRDDHEPGLLPPQLEGGRVELADRRRGRPGRQGRELTSTGRCGSGRRPSAPGTPTASSASASIGIIRAASRRTCSSTWSRR